MTVQELIDQLLKECGDLDPSTVKVEKSYFDVSSYDTLNDDITCVESYGGNDYPLTIVVS